MIKWGLKQTAAAAGILAALTLTGPSCSIGIPPRVWPDCLRVIWLLMEGAVVAGFVLQLPFTYAAQRLAYEIRWYIVTDRSLRVTVQVVRAVWEADKAEQCGVGGSVLHQ